MNPRATLDATVRFLSRNLQAMGSSSEHNLSSFRVKVSISNPQNPANGRGHLNLSSLWIALFIEL